MDERLQPAVALLLELEQASHRTRLSVDADPLARGEVGTGVEHGAYGTYPPRAPAAPWAPTPRAERGAVLHLQLDSRPGIADVSADGLTLRFAGTPGLDVVATMTGTLPAAGVTVVVEVLAASHRVHVLDDGVVATEQVACVADGQGTALPASASHPAGRHTLRFTSTRPQLDGATLADVANDLRRSAGDAGALVVSFPGHADAITSVRLLPDGWETWHLYPGDRPHAVRTRTTVALP